MARIAKADVHAALDRAAHHITEAGASDGRVSRADIEKKLDNLGGTERALVDMFYRLVDHRDAAPGATVTATDVEKTLEYAKKKMVDKYDLNLNGLSKSEVAEMSRTGKLAVQLAKELKASPAPEVTGRLTTAQRVAMLKEIWDGFGIDESKVTEMRVEELPAAVRPKIEAAIRKMEAYDHVTPDPGTHGYEGGLTTDVQLIAAVKTSSADDTPAAYFACSHVEPEPENGEDFADWVIGFAPDGEQIYDEISWF